MLVGNEGVPVNAGEANGAAPVTSAIGIVALAVIVLVPEPFIYPVNVVAPVPPFATATTPETLVAVVAVAAFPVILVWSPVFVPDKFATAPLANIALVIAPFAIAVAFPVLVTTPVKFALVVTVAEFPVVLWFKVGISFATNALNVGVAPEFELRQTLN